MNATATGPALTGETIICFAPDPWEGLWRNRHQIMTRLARRNTVIYVEPRRYLGETYRQLRAGRLRWTDLQKPLLEPVSANSPSEITGAATFGSTMIPTTRPLPGGAAVAR